MALPNIFSQTPQEALIWASAVGTQTEIVKMLKATPIFAGIVGLGLGLAIFLFLYRLGKPTTGSPPTAKLIAYFLTLGAGISFLAYQNSSPFNPINARGTEWRQVPRVISNPRYSDLGHTSNGLYWYTAIHKAFAEVGTLLTSIVAYAATDPLYKDAPQYLVNALASSAKLSIDDPAIEQNFDELVARCSDTKQGQILGATSSLKTMFNMADPNCQAKYNTLVTNLKSWARAHRPRTLSITANTANALRSVGILSEADIDNKVIASAVKNYARIKAGEQYAFHNTNKDALIGGTDFWVNLSKGFNLSSNILSSVSAVRDFFGAERLDVEGIGARNEIAVIYNQQLALLPVARGYAKAIIAFTFVFAAIALCVGFSGYFFGWLKMTALFTLYEPLSAASYYFTTKIITTTETLKAMDSMRVDPLVLAGAHMIDSNLARMEAVYFCVQIGLLFTFAFAGIKALGVVRSVRNSYWSDMFSSFPSVLTLSHLRSFKS